MTPPSLGLCGWENFFDLGTTPTGTDCYLGIMCKPQCGPLSSADTGPPANPGPPSKPGTITVLESKTKRRIAPLTRVVCHDDPHTTMEFVVGILTGVFRLPHSRSVEVMLEVHQRGAGVVGMYPLSVAEKKVKKATALARANAFPLTFSIEED